MTVHTPASPATASPLRIWAALTLSELLRFARNPMGMVFTLLFPVIFFALFGLPNVQGKLGGAAAGPYLLVSFATYGLMLTAVSNFGLTIAREREMGWYRLLRVAPLSGLQAVAAKVTQALIVGLASVLLLFLFAGVAGGVWLPFGEALVVTVKLLLGMVPFLLLGLALAYLLSANAAVPIVNLLVLLLAFGSGLFIPLEAAPTFIRTIAPYLPSYHMAELGWGTLGAPNTGSAATHWLWLAGYALVFGAVALWAYRRDESKNYG